MNKFAWSYTQLKNYEICPKRHYHYDVAKDVKEPESSAMREGHVAHKAFEEYIARGKDLPMGLRHFEPMMANLASLPGDTYPEQKLALGREFQPMAWFDKQVWFRTVVDLVNVRGERGIVVDYKTGKPSEDLTQLQLISATVFHYMPEVMRIRARLLFVNHNRAEGAEFQREDLPAIWNEILPRVKTLETARREQEYPPKPSGLCVRYCLVESCPFHGRGTR